MRASLLIAWRFFRFLILITTATLAGSVFAGTYVLQSMTGGTVAGTDAPGPGGGNGQTYTFTYMQSQGTRGYSLTDGNDLSLTYSGTITATFVWVPNPNIPGFYDGPQFKHSPIPGLTDSANHFFQWSGVCSPLTEDCIWVTCALGNWQWIQNNSFAWGNATGAVIDGGVADGFVEPLQWSFLYTNSGNE